MREGTLSNTTCKRGHRRRSPWIILSSQGWDVLRSRRRRLRQGEPWTWGRDLPETRQQEEDREPMPKSSVRGGEDRGERGRSCPSSLLGHSLFSSHRRLTPKHTLGTSTQCPTRTRHSLVRFTQHHPHQSALGAELSGSTISLSWVSSLGSSDPSTSYFLGVHPRKCFQSVII